jgi:hypothetical protein
MAQTQNESDQATLSAAARLLELQSEENSALRDALQQVGATAQKQASEIQSLFAQMEALESLLMRSDTGLSEALTFLAAMRDGLSKISAATDRTIASFTEIGYASGLAKDVAALSNAVSETENTELLDAHEKYLRELKAKIKRVKAL